MMRVSSFKIIHYSFLKCCSQVLTFNLFVAKLNLCLKLESFCFFWETFMSTEFRQRLTNGGAIKLINIARREAEEEKEKRISAASKALARELLEITGNSGRALPDFVRAIDSGSLLEGYRCNIYKPKDMDQDVFRQHARKIEVALDDIANVEIPSIWPDGSIPNFWVSLISALIY